MASFLALTDERRQAVCTETGGNLKLDEVAVEKDFWVCWILKKLFTLPNIGEHLTFKGGTSLSKGWNLIQRFSEDIDMVIDRNVFDIPKEKQLEEGLGSSQMNKRGKILKAVCQKYVNEKIASSLGKVILSEIPTSITWSLEPDPDDEDQQTLLFKYQSVYPGISDYVLPRVKIEMGARGDITPSVPVKIEPYINQGYPDLFTDSFEVKALSPKRTFWEKVMLLCEEAYRDSTDKRRGKRNLSRHYYDLSCLIQSGIIDEAFSDLDLFGSVLNHRMLFFNCGRWMDYSVIKPGSLRLVPLPEHMADWESDYTDMADQMFYGTALSFSDVLAVISDFQDRFNSLANN